MSDEYYYRYDEVGTSHLATELNRINTINTSLRLSIWKVIKKTNAGVWITSGWVSDNSDKKFVLNIATKRFAYPTKELAYESWLARKKKHLRILKNKIFSIECALKIDKDSKDTWLVQEVGPPSYGTDQSNS